MTETIIPPVPENDNEIMESRSPLVMLISMILMISVLILCSVMLLYYAVDRGGETTENIFSRLDTFIEKGKEHPAVIHTADTADNPEPAVKESKLTGSVVINLFGGDKDDGSVRWPKLKLTGFGRSSDEEGAFAIINGKHVLVNSSIGDVRLVEIRAHGAVVEYMGEQRFLSVDPGR